MKHIEFIESLECISEWCPTLAKYGRNLTLLAAKDELPRCYARESEIEAIQIAIRRRTKPNILLTGEAGSGKTAIVEGLAQTLVDTLYQEAVDTGGYYVRRLIDRNLPAIYELSSGDLIAGTKCRGDFEERMQKIINELTWCGRSVLLFIDEAHLLTDLGSADGAPAASQLLKPSLARGDFNVIAASTDAEFDLYLKQDAAFIRRFTRLNVKPIPVDKRTELAKNILNEYSCYFKIPIDSSIDDNLLDGLLAGPLHDEIFPCVFVDIIDQAFAEASYRRKDKLDAENLKQTLYQIRRCSMV